MDAHTDEPMDRRTHAHTHDRHNAMTIARWSSASGAKIGRVHLGDAYYV